MIDVLSVVSNVLCSMIAICYGHKIFIYMHVCIYWLSVHYSPRPLEYL